jgi:hypothetical protein
MDKLLAGTTDDKSRGATGPPSPHHYDVSGLLPCRRNQGVDRLTVNHERTVRDSSRSQRTTPLVLEKICHFSSVPFRWDNCHSTQVRKQS